MPQVHDTKKQRDQSGNVLFLILIAVALFAALSYVVTNSSRSGGGDSLREKERLAASELLNYIVSVRSGVLRMLISGVPAERLSAYTPNRRTNNGAANTWNDNPSCTTDDCRIFSNKNGVIYKAFTHHAIADDGSFPPGESAPGENDIVLINVEGIGSEENEIALRIGRITPRICNAINMLFNGRAMFG